MSKHYVTQDLGIKIEVTDNSDDILKALQNAIERGLDAIGMNAVDHTVDNIVAVGAVDTGNLKNSINYKSDYGDKSVLVGTPVEYGKFVEMGTSKMEARPYLRPAVENNKAEYQQLMKDSLENA